ncbi:uncharacterized protein DNG_01491 [Cephalotrichum gorgonifer]|uniref:Hydrophobin n=1 Tax=Cephalotrichum gorgonifer TaxID=2041049 RepID=A0AAE8SRW0_9PEZI|nr:uncharacterized protein DNG_01491 [Cephalotrichum gorgonifer]
MFAIQTLVVAFAAFAAASPQGSKGKSVADVQATCSGNGSGNQISCCNVSKGDTGLDILGGLLGGACSPISIPIGLVAAAVPITDYCNTQVACCSGDQTGLVNVQCLPISV